MKPAKTKIAGRLPENSRDSIVDLQFQQLQNYKKESYKKTH